MGEEVADVVCPTCKKLVSGRLIRPIADDEVLVIRTKNPDSIDKVLKKLKKFPKENPIMFAVTDESSELVVCKRSQVCYTRDKRVVIKDGA